MNGHQHYGVPKSTSIKCFINAVSLTHNTNIWYASGVAFRCHICLRSCPDEQTTAPASVCSVNAGTSPKEAKSPDTSVKKPHEEVKHQLILLKEITAGTFHSPSSWTLKERLLHDAQLSFSARETCAFENTNCNSSSFSSSQQLQL